MAITSDDIKRVKDSIRTGDYVLATKPVSPGNHRQTFMVSKVVLMSSHVFVTEILGTAFPGIRTSYRYAELLEPGEVRIVTESEAMRAAEIFAKDRISFLESA